MARPKPLADFLDRCLGSALSAQGFAAADVVVAWPDIVGERLAAFSRPMRIDWPRKRSRFDPDGPADPATLVVRVESAFALEMQHLAPVVVERLNTYYGWRCVGRLVLKQGPVPRAAPRPASRPDLDPAERARVAAAVETVDEERLRAALERLGRAVVGAGKLPRTKP